MAERTLLVDGMYLAFSSFYANRTMRTIGGRPSGAVFGFVSRIEALIRELQPRRIAIAFDCREKTFRHQWFPEYKATRQEPPEDLLAQLGDIRTYVRGRGITLLEQPGFEADDLIALHSRAEVTAGREACIFSADKDLFQLIGPGIQVFHPKTKQLLDREGLKEFFGLYPEQIADFLSLTGDASDNIPGVPGIGEKTAVKLLEQFGTVDELLQRISQVEPRWREKLTTHRQSLELSRRLVDFSHIPPLPTAELPLFSGKLGAEVITLYQELSFHSMLKNLPTEAPPPVSEAAEGVYRVVRRAAELPALAEELRRAGGFAFDVETTDLDFTRARLVGVSVALPGHGYYLPFLHPAGEGGIDFRADDFRRELGPIFADPAVRKTGHNLKFDILHLRRHGIEVQGVYDDTMVMAYLLYPNRRSHGLKELSRELLQYTQVEYEALVGKGKSQRPLQEVELPLIARYCIDDARCSLQLAALLEPKLVERKLTELYRTVEMPLLPILTAMEEVGIAIDRPFLQRAARVLQQHILETEKEIYDMAGLVFNLNSSQQLGQLLFEKMNLPAAKKTRKTGAYSTDNEVLSELQGYPVVARIIAYRTYKKLLSTYVESLLETADADNRIHTSFNQTVTATGRLSSSNPNLQNIPVGEMGGVTLRRAFVAGAGKRLLSADYSQIELRVMAHFAADERLLEAFRQGRDIHQHTADLVFGPATLPEQRRELRRRAKIINFSIIYGSGPFSLSKELGVSVGEAKKFIDMYFDTYRGVKAFMEQTIAAAVADPLVRTLTGRQRDIPEVQSANRTIRENGQRMAVNTIIQGSAADIIKIAMCRIQERLAGWKSRLLLQVHDELVFEYPPEEEPGLCRLVKEEMEHAVPLSVPLLVSLKLGENWAEMQEPTPLS